MEEVIDAQALQQQHHVAHVGSLDLGHRVGLQLVLERPRREQPEALARLRPSRSPRPAILSSSERVVRIVIKIMGTFWEHSGNENFPSNRWPGIRG